MKLLIKQGHILDPANDMDGIYDLLIENGRIKAVEKQIEEQVDEIIDARNKYVMPGLIDLHVHLREPGYEYKETIQTGSKAAARGGFTTICAMPNTNPATDSPERVEAVLKKGKEEAVVNVLPIGAVTKGQAGEELTDISAMAGAGAIGISEDGKSVMDTSLYLQGMKAANEAGIPVFAHCEDKSLAGDGVINEGKKAREFNLPGIGNEVEDVIVARDIILAKAAKAKLHLCHCSTRDSVTFIKMAKEELIQVTAEVCPHHFTMSEDEIMTDHGNYKMNPPLRSREDVMALKEGLRDNIIDVIATDHAPHGEEEKNQSMREAPFGIVGLETAFALTMTELVKTGYLSPLQMVEKLSYNPARILGIEKGTLSPGKIADIVIGNPHERYKIDKNEFASKGHNTPFHGKEVYGRIETTIVSGKVVYQYNQE